MREVTVIIALLLTAESAGAQAQDPRIDQARTEFEQGDAHYESGRYGLAAQEFRRAFDLLAEAGHPRALMVLFNLGRTLEQLPGRESEARAAYRRVIDESPRTSEFENTLQMATVGLRELNARMGSRSSSATVSPIGPIVLGAGGAVLIPGLITVGVAYGQDQDLVARCPARVGCDEALRPEVDATRNLGIAGDVLWIAGAVVALTGLVLTFALQEDGDENETAQLQLHGAPGGAIASLRWRAQ